MLYICQEPPKQYEVSEIFLIVEDDIDNKIVREIIEASGNSLIAFCKDYQFVQSDAAPTTLENLFPSCDWASYYPREGVWKVKKELLSLPKEFLKRLADRWALEDQQIATPARGLRKAISDE